MPAAGVPSGERAAMGLSSAVVYDDGMPDHPTPRRRFQFRLRTLLIGVALLSLAVGCGQSEPLPNNSPQKGQQDKPAAEASTPSQQHFAEFIRPAMGSNEVRFKHWGDIETVQNMPTISVSWEVRKNDYWEQHRTMIFLPPEPIEPSKQYSARGDVEALSGMIWITEVQEAKKTKARQRQ